MNPEQYRQQVVAESGLIQGGFGQYFMVQTRLGVVRASKAFSCLVVPVSGDRVALQWVDDQLYILAILERSTDTETRLAVPGDLAICSPAGKVQVRAAEGLALSTAAELELVGKSVEMAAVDTRIHSLNLTLQGERLVSHWKEVRTVTEAFHLVADTLTEALKNAFRKVDGLAQENSRNSFKQVDETLSVRSHHAVITSRKDMKIDGERIHMG